jgi:hypothetical protein
LNNIAVDGGCFHSAKMKKLKKAQKSKSFFTETKKHCSFAG